MPQTVERFERVEESATLRMSALVRELRAEGVDVIDMASGAPDFITPEHIREGAKEALDRGETFTTDTKGIPELREQIAIKLREENGIETNEERVVVTAGTKHAVFQSLFALLESGDEAIVPDPSWVSYRQMVRLNGGRVKRLPLDPDAGFALGNTNLAAVVSDETQVMLVNTPANPSGAVFSKEELAEIRDLAIDHDFWVVTDEIYERMVYGVPHHSLAAMEGMADRTITTSGFSKSYAMTGWRLGYLTGPRHVVDSIEKLQAHSVTCTTSFAQYGALAALEGPDTVVEEMRQTYESRLEVLVEELSAIGVDIDKPGGAFFCFVPIGPAYDDVTLCEKMLKEEGVGATPGSAFGMDGYVRLSITTEADRIRDAVPRIGKYLHSG